MPMISSSFPRLWWLSSVASTDSTRSQCSGRVRNGSSAPSSRDSSKSMTFVAPNIAASIKQHFFKSRNNSYQSCIQSLHSVLFDLQLTFFLPNFEYHRTFFFSWRTSLLNCILFLLLLLLLLTRKLIIRLIDMQTENSGGDRNNGYVGH